MDKLWQWVVNAVRALTSGRPALVPAVVRVPSTSRRPSGSAR
jgi:hypothetical protein